MHGNDFVIHSHNFDVVASVSFDDVIADCCITFVCKSSVMGNYESGIHIVW